MNRYFKIVLLPIALCLCLYFFVCSLEIMSISFRLIAGKYAKEAFSQSSILQNPLTGLMIGVIVTLLVQSSSTSTSIVISMVASEVLTVRMAIPIIMGANIGTTITSTLVSFSQVTNRTNFKRAYAGAIIHDIFNFLTVSILLPLEIVSRYLETVTGALVAPLSSINADGANIEILNALTKPLTNLIIQIDDNLIGSNKSIIKHTCIQNNVKKRCQFLFESANWGDWIVGLVLLIISLAVLCSCLIAIVKVLSSIFKGRFLNIITRILNSKSTGFAGYLMGYVAIFIGAILTLLIQSSSVFTSLMTPMVGLGAVSLERVFPLILGSNLGTTITGILAALSNSTKYLQFSLQIALCHTFFNITGILVWFPIPYVRNIPIRLARYIGDITAEYRWFAVFYIVLVFIIIPTFIYVVSLAGQVFLIVVVSLILLLILVISVINLIQRKKPTILPKVLQTWTFLPVYMRSLKPYDTLLKKCSPCFSSSSDMESDATSDFNSDTLTIESIPFEPRIVGELVPNKNGKEIFVISNLYKPERFTQMKSNSDKSI